MCTDVLTDSGFPLEWQLIDASKKAPFVQVTNHNTESTDAKDARQMFNWDMLRSML